MTQTTTPPTLTPPPPPSCLNCHKSGVGATILKAAAAVLSAALFGGDAVAQMPTPLWNGTTFNDSINATGANRLHSIGILGQGVSAAVLDTLFDTTNTYLDGKILAASAGFAGVTVSSGQTELIYQNQGMTYAETVTDRQVGAWPLYDYDVMKGVGINFVTTDNTMVNVDELGNEDFISHGTHVAGTVSAMAPNAKLLLLNSSVLGVNHVTTPGHTSVQDFSDGTTHAIDYAASIAKDYNLVALNGSYGYSDPLANAAAGDAYDPMEAAAIANLRANGVIGVFASGNDGYNNFIGSPAASSAATAIGALHSSGMITSFSNQSAQVVLLAPGENILSSVPNWVDASEMQAFQGTSMASPHITGGLTLLASGARNASTEEILQSMIDGSDRYVYDPTMMLPPEFESWSGYQVYIDYCSDLGVDITQSQTLDTWRRLRMAYSLGATTPAEFASVPSLDTLDYRFLRVDLAYQDLTHKRTNGIADRVGVIDGGLSGILYAYADELGADINQDTADIFQRLDAQDTATQAVVARQMSPRFAGQTTESAHLGLVGLHRSLGRRTEISRLSLGASGRSCNPCDEVAACDPCESVKPCNPCDSVCGPRSKLKVNGWVEGFGSGVNYNGSLTNGSYDGHFAGTAFGVERTRGNRTGGIFGSWANHRISGDGRSVGNWGTVGLYGRIDWKRSFVEGSAAYGFGKYDMNRYVSIPGATFTDVGGGFIVLDPMWKNAASSADAYNFSTRVAGGFDRWRVRGWKVGPRAEMSLSYLSLDGYTESGADSLNLVTNRYNTTYLEGGIGLFAGKKMIVDGQVFVATAKMMGMAGGTMGNDLTGSFRQYGSAYTVNANHMSTAWAAPEASLSWNIRKGVTLSGTYTGRFGERYSENTGALGVNLAW